MKEKNNSAKIVSIISPVISHFYLSHFGKKMTNKLLESLEKDIYLSLIRKYAGCSIMRVSDPLKSDSHNTTPYHVLFLHILVRSNQSWITKITNIIKPRKTNTLSQYHSLTIGLPKLGSIIESDTRESLKATIPIVDTKSTPTNIKD